MHPWKEAPEIEFEHQIRGHGALKGEDDEVPAPYFMLRRPKYGSNRGWEALAHLDSEFTDIDLLVSRLGMDETPSLVGTTDGGKSVRVKNLFPDRYTNRRLRGTCYEVQVGPDLLPAKPDHQFVMVSFSNTDVALPEVRFPVRTADGEIKQVRDGVTGDPFLIDTQLGKAEFSRKFQWEAASVTGDQVPVRVPRPRFHVEVDDADSTQSPYDLFDKLDEDLKWLSRLLSFLSRRRVSWVYALVGSSWEKDDAPVPPQESELWRAGVVGDRPTDLDRFIAAGRMDRRDLDALLASLRAAPYNDALFHAMGFLVGTMTQRHIEGQMMNAFTALEATVGGFCRAHNLEFILDADTHRQISRVVKSWLRNAVRYSPAVAESDEEEIYDALRRKMAGSHTRRRSFADRARDLVEESGADWRDLWPPDTNLRSAISRAYGRRSKLIHGGKRSGAIPTWVDIYRIHALTERVIFELIGGDPDWHGPFAYRHCERLRSFDS